MKMNLRIGLLFGLMFLMACTPTDPAPSVSEPDLRFVPQVTMFEEGKVQFDLGIANEASRDQPMIEDANIQVTITDEAGQIRNQMKVVDIGPISGDMSTFPLTYEAVYDPGRYVVSLTGEGLPSLTFPFEIREANGVRKLAAPPEFINPFTEFTLTATDL